MAYAEGTTVPVEKSLAEIVTLIKRAGSQRIRQTEDVDALSVEFFLQDRLLRFSVTLPAVAQMPVRDGRGSILSDKQRADRAAASHRQRARALLLVIKAKLESVESGVETFEQAFLAHVVLADNRTVYEQVAAPIAIAYQTGKPQTLMLSGPGA